MKEKRNILKEHKKEIVIGISLAAAGVVCYLVFKNKDALQEAAVNFGKAKETIHELAVIKDDVTEIEITSAKEVFKTVDVSSHKRKLPEGWHASEKTLRIAIEKAIPLAENETIVSAYQRTQKVAA